ncbi:uncharacterized protein LOC122978844 isoform X1 [Thunnus albacares]|uniref:uncharacterized protein LOC121910325 isoform X1 n=2 Tax=Thunnus maccoyii TaxID=8240 RepID=UPI001C4D0E7C|nr:uncharacterized protein LOC121910325 isoform X1 [Thunnus maccoyii]XP_044201807.1 uncharacterized protein LOC122978844 isoform X1 [Thunnus albacares]
MVRVCAFPNCTNKMSPNTSRSFHRLPLLDRDTLKLWLVVLQMDANTPVHTLRLADYRVCSDHFERDDYCQPKKRRNPIPKHFFLKKNAVPRVERPAADTVELQDNQAVMDRPRGQSRSIGIQVNTPETCAATIEKPAPQYIVDEEAIMQLMKTCPMCDRQCRCSKHTRGPYFIVYQNCYFCDFQRKWASQPEALNANAYKAYIPSRKKLKSNDTVTVETEAQSSQRNKTNISESNQPLKSCVTASTLSLDIIDVHK